MMMVYLHGLGAFEGVSYTYYSVVVVVGAWGYVFLSSVIAHWSVFILV